MEDIIAGNTVIEARNKEKIKTEPIAYDLDLLETKEKDDYGYTKTLLYKQFVKNMNQD